MNPELTEPLKDFPTTVRIKRLASHWKGTELTYTAGAHRSKQIHRILNPVKYSRTYTESRRPEYCPSQFKEGDKQLNTGKKDKMPTLPSNKMWVEITNTL